MMNSPARHVRPGRIFRSLICLGLLGTSPWTVVANEPIEELPPGRSDRIVVRRLIKLNESLPELGARLYDQVDYELYVRRLRSDIKLAEARLQAQRERMAVYDKYFHNTPALLVTRQNARLAILESEARIDQLKREKRLALWHRADQVRLRKLLLAAGQARLALDE